MEAPPGKKSDIAAAVDISHLMDGLASSPGDKAFSDVGGTNAASGQGRTGHGADAYVVPRAQYGPGPRSFSIPFSHRPIGHCFPPLSYPFPPVLMELRDTVFDSNFKLVASSDPSRFTLGQVRRFGWFAAFLLFWGEVPYSRTTTRQRYAWFEEVRIQALLLLHATLFADTPARCMPEGR